MERGSFRKPEMDLETMQRHISGIWGLRELDERGQLEYLSLSQGFKELYCHASSHLHVSGTKVGLGSRCKPK